MSVTLPPAVNEADRELLLHLEWDRGTEQPRRLRAKVAAYAGYFNDRNREFHRILDRHVDDVLAALRTGCQPPIHARAGRRTLELAIASINSFETGRRVPTIPGEH